MGEPPSRPARHTRVYMSGFGVCGGLRMMGASGGAAPCRAFSVAVSTPKLPVLASRRASSVGAVPSVVRPVPEGAAKGGGWVTSSERSPHAEGMRNHRRASFPNKPCREKPVQEVPQLCQLLFSGQNNVFWVVLGGFSTVAKREDPKHNV